MDQSVLGITVTPKSSDPMTTSEKYTFSETMPLAGFLQANPVVDRDKLAEIASFVRGDKKEFSDIDLLNEIRHIETRLGAPRLGTKRIDNVYQYIKIQSQISNLEKERDWLLA